MKVRTSEQHPEKFGRVVWAYPGVILAPGVPDLGVVSNKQGVLQALLLVTISVASVQSLYIG